MRILVVGGAGHIGSCLVEKCVSEGHEVFVYDNLSTGSLVNLNKVRDKIRTIDELTDWSFDLIFHLGGIVGVDKVMSDPYNCLTENISLTHKILSKCKFEKIVFTSSSEVYGTNEIYPLRNQRYKGLKEEDPVIIDDTTTARGSYAISKLACENMIANYCKSNLKKYVIARLFNTVGPKQSDAFGMVLPKFVSALAHKNPLQIYDNGNQVRTFTHVNDTVEALYILGVRTILKHKVYNIGNSKNKITIKNLAKLVLKLCGSSSTFYTTKDFYRKNEELVKVPNTERIDKELGLKNKLGLEDTVMAVINGH